MSTSPLVSVLVPVYDGARFLDAALTSIRAQHHTNLEILVKDDGSTDGSAEIASRHAADDPRIHLVAGPPSGGAVANHIALAERASGDYVKFCHQDDLLDPRHVDLLLRPMLADPSVVLSTSVRSLIDADGRHTTGDGSYAPITTPSQVLDGRAVIDYVIRLGLNQIGEPTVGLFRNGVVAADRMFTFGDQPLTALFDLGLWFNLLVQGDLYFDTRPLSSYRTHDRSLMKRPMTVVNCPLEWIGVAAEAHRRGLLPRGEAMRRLGTSQHAFMERVEGYMAGNTDPAVHAALADVAERHAAAVTALTGVRRPVGVHQ